MSSTRTDTHWASWGVSLAFGLTLLFSTAWAADALTPSAGSPAAATPASMEELAWSIRSMRRSRRSAPEGLAHHKTQASANRTVTERPEC